MSRGLLRLATRLHDDESGQGLVEYLLILGLIVLASVAGMQGVATQVSNAFTALGNKLGTYVS